jgi:catalase
MSDAEMRDELDPEAALDRIARVYGGPHAARSLHAKGRFYSGTFTASADARELCRAAHLQGEPVPVTVRWSDASGHPRASDTAPDVRGMAVKFHTAAGDTDLLGQTAPRFPVRDAEAFVQMTEASAKPWLLPLFMARHPSAVPGLLANLRARSLVPPHSFAEATYYPIHAYGWLAPDGARSWVRYVLRPLATEADRLEGASFSGRDRLAEEMSARLDRGPVRFDLRVTVAAENDDPHDPMSVWKGARELSAGTVEVTATAPDPEADGGGPVVFDPVRMVDGIMLSSDPILLYRPGAYSVSVTRRLS